MPLKDNKIFSPGFWIAEKRNYIEERTSGLRVHSKFYDDMMRDYEFDNRYSYKKEYPGS